MKKQKVFGSGTLLPVASLLTPYISECSREVRCWSWNVRKIGRVTCKVCVPTWDWEDSEAQRIWHSDADVPYVLPTLNLRVFKRSTATEIFKGLVSQLWNLMHLDNTIWKHHRFGNLIDAAPDKPSSKDRNIIWTAQQQNLLRTLLWNSTEICLQKL